MSSRGWFFVISILVFGELSGYAQSTARWERVVDGYLDRELHHAYSGGDAFSQTTPTLFDLDRDSDLDLVIGMKDGTLSVVLNEGVSNSLTWSIPMPEYAELDVGSSAAPTFFDVDSDASPDLLIGSYTGQLFYYRNTGTLSAPVWSLVTNKFGNFTLGRKTTPVSCDIDGDSDEDLFVGNSDGTITYFNNTGTNIAAWVRQNNYQGINLDDDSKPAFCDIDGDLDFDLFIGGRSDRLFYYKNTGSVTVAQWSLVSTNYGNLAVSSPFFTDVDGDADQDLITSDDEDGLMLCFENTGTIYEASWSAAEPLWNTIDVGDGAIPETADIDDDQDYDLLIGCEDGLVLYRNNGTSRIPNWEKESYNDFLSDLENNGEDNASPGLVDIDHDGDLDLFLSTMSGFFYHENTGTTQIAQWAPAITNAEPIGSFNVTNSYEEFSVPYVSQFAFCDIDADADYDLFIEAADGVGFLYYENDGTAISPSWLAPVSVPGLDSPYFENMDFYDVDDDADYDLIGGDFWGHVNYYENTGTSTQAIWGSIRTNFLETSVGWYAAPTFSDLDGDGDEDLLIGEADGGVNFYRNNRSIDSGDKALIIAGSQSDTDSLAASSDYLANTAYNTLCYSGYTENYIHYLSRSEDKRVDGDATWSNVSTALRGWARGADRLFIYLVDHGGALGDAGYVRLNDSQILTAVDLDAWLDDLQDDYNTEVTVVLDFCYAGSFLDELTYDGSAQRTVIAACSSYELNYFIADGAISFSDAFFSGILSGMNFMSAFSAAQEAMLTYQTAWIDDNGDGLYDDSDGNYAATLQFENAATASSERPAIGSVASDQSLSDETAATLWAADISASFDVDRVWCFVVPPSATSDDLDGLPEIELSYDAADQRYEVLHDGFSENGVYKVVYYAEDASGAASFPRQSYVTQSGFDEKVIVVACDSENVERQTKIRTMAERVYGTLRARLFSDDAIYFVNTEAGASVDASPSIQNILNAVTNWASEADKLTLYLVGEGQQQALRVNASETLSAATLDDALDRFQVEDRKVNIILESDYSGSFVEVLQPPANRERIVITSSKTNQTSSWMADGLISFSQYFMSFILDGNTVGESFTAARRVIKYASGSLRQDAQLDDNGNGVANEKSEDGAVANQRYIGSAFVTADDAPSIGSVTASAVLSDGADVTLWASNVISAHTLASVTCLLMPPTGDGVELELVWNATTERYETVYTLDEPGTYTCTFWAEDAAENVSIPVQSEIMLADAYETDNSATRASAFVIGQTQSHNFHERGDEDWVKFYAVSDFVYEIETTQWGTNSDLVMEIYYEETDGTLVLVDYVDDNGSGEEVGEYTTLSFPTAGMYYVHVSSWLGWELGSEYGLDVRVPTGGSGHLMVIVVDKMNSGQAPANAVITLDGMTTATLNGGLSATFTGISDGVHTVEVSVANGYLNDEDPVFPSQSSNADNYLYGNPKRVTVTNGTWTFAIFQFIPSAQIIGAGRDAWTGAWLEDMTITCTSLDGPLAGLVYDRYPNFASYENLWATSLNGRFPTNVFLPQGDWMITVTKEGYEDVSSLLTLSVGEQVDLSTLLFTPDDQNGNGMADSWETMYASTDSLGEDDDADGDGHSNLQEYYAGTNPEDAASQLGVDAVQQTNSSGFVAIIWPVENGRNYVVLGKNSLTDTDSSWTTLGGPWEATNHQSFMQWTDANPANGRFYRVNLNY